MLVFAKFFFANFSEIRSRNQKFFKFSQVIVRICLYKKHFVLYNIFMRVVLASNSPRRKELFAKVAADFEIIPAVSPEVCSASEPREVVERLALHKAEEVRGKNPDALVVGCDTVVDLDGKILGKPHDKAEARQMLDALSGRAHLVHTGVCVLYKAEKRIFCETSQVVFRKPSSREIEAYVASGAPLDKAGAYGIQECGFVENFVGSYYNIVGLPVERLRQCLAEMNCGVRLVSD